jgi:hypothetical protein
VRHRQERAGNDEQLKPNAEQTISRGKIHGACSPKSPKVGDPKAVRRFLDHFEAIAVRRRVQQRSARAAPGVVED